MLPPDRPDALTETNAPGLEDQPAHKHWTTSQKQSIARMLVAGISPHQIAASYGVSVGRINRLDRDDPETQAFKERFAADVTRQMVMTKFRMFEKLERAVEIMDHDGLQSPDTRVRIEAAKWWFDKTIPPPKQDVVHAGGVEMRLPEAVIDAIVHMGKNDAGLRELQRTKLSMLSRVRQSINQLPTAVPVAVESTAEPADESSTPAA